MYYHLISFTCLTLSIQLISTNDADISFGHDWIKRDNTVSIYFDVSNATLNEYRYYFFDFRPFASPHHVEYFARQRLIDTHNVLNIIGLHENDYVSCISLIDEYENVVKPRSTCYEFTLGEKIIGSHHGGSSGYLAPLLFALAFILHVFIAIVHHIKAKHYGHKLLERFIDVNPKVSKQNLMVKHSLKQLDQPFVSTSVHRRLSRVTIDTDENNNNTNPLKKINGDSDILTISQQPNRRISMGVMQTIQEHIP